MKHAYSQGAWYKPWYCETCHPKWYVISEGIVAVLGVTVAVLFIALAAIGLMSL